MLYAAVPRFARIRRRKSPEILSKQIFKRKKERQGLRENACLVVDGLRNPEGVAEEIFERRADARGKGFVLDPLMRFR